LAREFATIARRSTTRLARRGSLAVWVALIVLFAVSPLLASGSLGRSAILSMLPFAAVLMIAAIGQTLVIGQGGLDFSVPGAIALSAVIVAHVGADGHGIVVAIVVALAACIAGGVLNGVLVSRGGVPPIIATLGVNSLLIGAAVQVSQQTVVPAPADLTRLMLDKTAGIPNTFLIACALVAGVAFVMRRTVFGREYEFAGMSPAAARVAGMPVARMQIAGYAIAAASYAVAGIVLAGYIGNPDINAGNPYLLSTVAAVVLGGASLAGGRASVVATGAGALFLSQLNQVVLASGSEIWAQYMIQGAVIALGMALRAVPLGFLVSSRRDGSAAEPPQGTAAQDLAPDARSQSSAPLGVAGPNRP
jgi:ribose transport system permease protein